MRRREFIAGISATAASSLAARAQPRTIPVLGSLNLGSPTSSRSSGASGLDGRYVAAFRQGLVEAGFVEGQTLTIENRWAYNQTAQLPLWRQNSSNAR
jgi:putative tryptophan/tyrosine transport system substrate-binding protein